MTKEAKIVIVAAIGLGLFVAFNSLSTEYARIQARVEVTQAKVDALADELQATTATVHAAIKSITDRFLANEETEAEAELAKAVKSTEKQGISDVSTPKTGVSVPTIIMHSGYSCGPCNAWISNDMPKWMQSGWKVEVIKELDSARAWPWYEITDRDGARFEVNGPLNNSNFQAAKLGK
jgi:hypothetical protein